MEARDSEMKTEDEIEAAIKTIEGTLGCSGSESDTASIAWAVLLWVAGRDRTNFQELLDGLREDEEMVRREDRQ